MIYCCFGFLKPNASVAEDQLRMFGALLRCLPPPPRTLVVMRTPVYATSSSMCRGINKALRHSKALLHPSEVATDNGVLATINVVQPVVFHRKEIKIKINSNSLRVQHVLLHSKPADPRAH